MYLKKDYIILLLFIIFLHAVGIYLYASGFLITSVRIEKQSVCDDPQMKNTYYASLHPPEKCWTTPIVNKTAIYLVDALRYDFAFTANYPPLFEKITSEEQLKLYHNNMPIFNSLEEEYPSQVGRYHFIPDPPTTTAQRVKAMTTGGIPAFIEVSNTFNNVVVDEDSLVHQFKKNGMKTVFAGDSLWTDMFPEMFDEVLTGPSLDIADLHSVDQICDDALMKYQNDSTFDVMITHFLGVDHIGHYYQPDHEIMQEKLKQINNILDRSLHGLPENSLALVFGDHGVTEEGNHGGSTDKELDGALYIYDKRKKKGTPMEPATVTQVDIVPTIALSMGLPIPFSNTGTPIRDVFLGRDFSLENVQEYVNVLNITTNQIINYLYENARVNNRNTKWIDVAKQKLREIQRKEIEDFNDLNELYEHMNVHEQLSHSLHDQFVSNNASFKFNYMICGTIILIVSIVVTLLYILGYPQFEIDVQKLFYGLILGMVPAVFVRRVVNMKMARIDQYIFFTALMAGIHFVSSYSRQFNNFIFNKIKPTTTVTIHILIVTVISIVYSLGQYTDSFIKEEKYTSFYIAEIISFLVVYFNYLNGNSNKHVLIIHLLSTFALSFIQYFSLHLVSLVILPLFIYFMTQSNIVSLASVVAMIYHMLKPYPTSAIGIILPDIIYALVIVRIILAIKNKEGPLHYLIALIPFMTVILPMEAATVLLLFVLMVYIYQHYEYNDYTTLYFIMLGIHFFFLSGHAFQFSDIQFNSGFIGVPFYSFVFNGIIIMSNTFFFPCVCVLVVAALAYTKSKSSLNYTRSSLLAILFFVYQLVSISLFTYFVSGHLEIFRIFTPKVCFDGVILLVLDVVTLLVSFVFKRADPCVIQHEITVQTD